MWSNARVAPAGYSWLLDPNVQLLSFGNWKNPRGARDAKNPFFRTLAMIDKSDRIGSPLVHIERAGYLCTPTFTQIPVHRRSWLRQRGRASARR